LVVVSDVTHSLTLHSFHHLFSAAGPTTRQLQRQRQRRLVPSAVAARDGDVVTANVEVLLEDGTPMASTFE
jgi:hypothetical protein